MPPEFNYWCGLSLVSACAGDRVWLEYQRDDPIIPNLYVLLLGKSGAGKGQAIKRVCRLVRDNPELLEMTYYGKVTGQGLADWMGGRTQGTTRINVGAGAQAEIALPGRKHPYAYVINEELALDIGRGNQADDFVKYMTGLYSGTLLPWRDRTRTAGEVKLDKACLVWLAGTTQEWLVASVNRDAIEGGFFARTVTVEGREMPRREYATYPRDVAELALLLGRLVGILRTAAGKFNVTPLAREIERNWYMRRPRPTDTIFEAAWSRERVLVAKIAMLLGLGEWCVAWALWEDAGGEGDAPPLLIADRHLLEAIRSARQANRATPRLVGDVNGGRVTKLIDVVRKYMVEHKRCEHSVLLRYVAGRGYKRDELVVAVMDLIEQEFMGAQLIEVKAGYQRRVYEVASRVVMRRRRDGVREFVESVAANATEGTDADPAYDA